MSLLFKHFRAHQVFGANTDVGKTILITALVRASASRDIPTFYLKPVSTGHLEDADDSHIQTYASSSPFIKAKCFYRFDDPVSPHLAASRSNRHVDIPSDATLIQTIANYMRQCANDPRPAVMFIETAGGVNSPTLTGSAQLDAYRPLFLPTILVGDSKLGGISTTISAYESLRMRGYIVDSVLMFRDDYYRNWEYLRTYFNGRGVPLTAVEHPPPRVKDKVEDQKLTQDYYNALASNTESNILGYVLDHLDDAHARRVQDIQSMPERALQNIWWPFVQHTHVTKKDVTVIDSAHGDFFSTLTTGNNPSLLKPEFDSSASWWTQALGHADPLLAMAAATAAGRYGHVLFPQSVHMPALQLAEWLVENGPGKGWASRAFFSDNGSTGMEVAIKMALRKFTQSLTPQATVNPKEIGIIGLKGSYHGDTLGAMDACEEGVYTTEWHNSKGYWFETPEIVIRDGRVQIDLPQSIAERAGARVIEGSSLNWVYDVANRVNTPLAEAYGNYIRNTIECHQEAGRSFGALILEPLVLGAGGMIFSDPLFQRIMVDTVRTSPKAGPQISVIFDEVFVGMYRLGMQSTISSLGVQPDISVHAKILTGGLIPMCVTLASENIFKSFLGSTKAEALLHGHSYTAHPIGCQVANETIRQVEHLAKSPEWKAAKKQWLDQGGGTPHVWSFWNPSFVNAVSTLPNVDSVMALGTVLAIKLRDESSGYASSSAQEVLKPLKEAASNLGSATPAPGGLPYGVNYRTLGNVAYFMTNLNTSSDLIRSLEDRIWKVLRAAPTI